MDNAKMQWKGYGEMRIEDDLLPSSLVLRRTSRLGIPVKVGVCLIDSIQIQQRYFEFGRGTSCKSLYRFNIIVINFLIQQKGENSLDCLVYLAC